MPAGATAGGFLDIWQRPITDTGQTGPDHGGGGKYLIVPPDSDIREMRGYIVARSPSNQVWFAARARPRCRGRGAGRPQAQGLWLESAQ